MRPNRGFEYVSPSVATVTGYMPEEHHADPNLTAELVHPDDRYQLGNARRALRGGALPPRL